MYDGIWSSGFGRRSGYCGSENPSSWFMRSQGAVCGGQAISAEVGRAACQWQPKTAHFWQSKTAHFREGRRSGSDALRLVSGFTVTVISSPTRDQILSHACSAGPRELDRGDRPHHGPALPRRCPLIGLDAIPGDVAGMRAPQHPLIRAILESACAAASRHATQQTYRSGRRSSCTMCSMSTALSLSINSSAGDAKLKPSLIGISISYSLWSETKHQPLEYVRGFSNVSVFISFHKQPKRPSRLRC